MYDAPQAPLSPREPAPGEKAAFHCGLWSVLLNVLCGCFPVAIPLGIVAIVKHGKAERAAQAEPERYARPATSGKVLGIVGLCLTLFSFVWIGIVSAIAMPALLSQRDNAKATVLRSQVYSAASETSRMADELAMKTGHPATPEEVVDAVLAEAQMQYPSARNAYAVGVGPYRKGSAPAQDGEITLEPQTQYQDPHTGNVYPAVVIRGRFRARGGGSETLEKPVPLD